MKKILFTDLFSTLISQNAGISKRIYNNRNKEMDIVARYLNEFLLAGNYVVVVTTPGSHDTFGGVFNKTLVELHSRIDVSLRSRIIYYMQGDDKLYPEDNIITNEIDGKKYYFGEHEVCGIHVDEKEDAVTDFLHGIKMPYQIYAIGDSDRDIKMLLKVQELGGQSSFIAQSLFRQDITTDGIIKNQLYVEFHTQILEALNSMSMEEKLNGGINDQLISLFEKREQRKQELYEKLYSGDLNLEKMNENYHNFIEVNFFNESQQLDEQTANKVINMSCYPSFTKYYTKVLKRY